MLKCYLAGWLTSASVSSCSTAAPEPDLALLHLPFCLALLLPLRPTMGCFQLAPSLCHPPVWVCLFSWAHFTSLRTAKKLTLFGPQTALPVADRASPQVYPETPLPCVTQGLWDMRGPFCVPFLSLLSGSPGVIDRTQEPGVDGRVYQEPYRVPEVARGSRPSAQTQGVAHPSSWQHQMFLDQKLSTSPSPARFCSALPCSHLCDCCNLL